MLGQQLHLIEPDGSNDRVVWREPAQYYTITGVSWRPDGGEIAFSSDHEEATSFYERDIYAIRPDGSGLRKLTNGPTHDKLSLYGKGTVTVTVTNGTFDSGPYFVNVLGTPEPQMITLAPGASQKLTFKDVADLGANNLQPVVVIEGGYRWWGASAAADVKAGATVDAGLLNLGANPIPHFGADVPFWRADGSRVGYIGLPSCLLQQVDANPPPGSSYQPLLDPKGFDSDCAVDWSPNPAQPDQLLVGDTRNYVNDGSSSIYRVKEGASSPGTPLVTLHDYVRITDLRWIPDGSGFVVAHQNDLTDENVNLFEFTFATGAVKQLTNFTGSYARGFAISPDGRQIVFERVSALDGPSDLWIVNRDGSNAHLLVRGGQAPAW